MKKIYLLSFITKCILLSNLNIYSQDISVKDSEEIKLISKRKVQNSLKDVLNFIADELVGDAEKIAIIKDSYSNSNIQVFYDAKAIIEDDINPNFTNSTNIQDLSVEKYLNNFDVLYKKSTENSIDFTVNTISNVKKGDSYFYIKVYFDSQFNNRHKTINVDYKKTKRVAELRVEKVGKKWVANITRVAFGSPEEESLFGKNDVTLKNDSLSVQFNSSLESEKELAEANEQKRQQQKFEKLLSDADNAFKTKEFDLALQAYEQSLKDYKSEYEITSSINLKRLISITRKEIAKEQEAKRIEEEQKLKALKEANYIKYISDAKKFERNRKYSKAIELYQMAFQIKPDSLIIYEENIRTLNKELSIKTETDEMYLEGKYKELKKKFDKFINDEKKYNSDYYLGRAKCLIQLAESPKSILKDLDEAINLDYLNTEAFIVRAEIYLQQNNIPKAIADYTSFLNIEKDSASIFIKRASLRIRTNNVQGAFEDYDKAISIAPQKDNYYVRGQLYTQIFNWDKAIADYTQAIKLDTSFTLAYFYRGDAFFNLKKYKNAGIDFNKVISAKLDGVYIQDIQNRANDFYAEGDKLFANQEIDNALKSYVNSVLVMPSFSRAWYKIGECYFTKEEYVNAIENYTKAVFYDDKYDDAFFKRGLSKYKLGQTNESIIDFHKTNDIVSNYYQAVFYEGKANMKLQKFDIAISLFQKIKIAKPDIEKIYSKAFFAEVHNNLGICMYKGKTKYYQEAIPEFSTAIKLDEQYAEAYYFRALTYIELSKYEDAIADLDKSIIIEPAMFEKYIAKGNSQYTLSKYDEAILSFEKAIEYDKKEENIFYSYKMKAYCYLKNERYEDAIVDYLKAIDKDSSLCDEWFFKDLALAHLFAGQTANALEAINKSLKKNNQNLDTQYVLACYYIQNNNIPDAMKVFEKLLETKYINNQYIKKDKLLNKIDPKFRDNKELKELIKKYAK